MKSESGSSLAMASQPLRKIPVEHIQNKKCPNHPEKRFQPPTNRQTEGTFHIHVFSHLFAKQFLKANRELTEKALETTGEG